MTNLTQVPVSTVCIFIAELCSIGVMQLLYWYAGVEAIFLPLLHGISPRVQMAEKYTFLRLLQGCTSCPHALEAEKCFWTASAWYLRRWPRRSALFLDIIRSPHAERWCRDLFPHVESWCGVPFRMRRCGVEVLLRSSDGCF